MYPIDDHRIHTAGLYATMQKSNELARNYFNSDLYNASVYCLADCIAIGYTLLEISNRTNCFADLPEDVGPAYMQGDLLTLPQLMCLAEKLFPLCRPLRRNSLKSRVTGQKWFSCYSAI